MGMADVVPGVSGGTMAFILGIYEELIAAIRSFDLYFLRLISGFRMKDALGHVSWQFLVAVLCGIFAAIFSLARALSWVLHHHPILIWSFFFGLILASVLVVSRHIDKWAIPLAACMFLGLLGGYLLVGMVPVSTPDSFWFLFLCGAVAICAMILPGISGSFILVLLGKYEYILEAVNNRDVIVLFVVAGGAVIGLLSFVRLLNWLLKRYHEPTIAVLTGLMLGSLRKVWPWKRTLDTVTDRHGSEMVLSQTNIFPGHWDKEVMSAICLMVIGFLVVFFLHIWAEKKKK
ncbi:MAG: DUF368 domain-containing protein [Deltaproteobacteria bacterium]|nr:DUF368 domain-containing protein [Deltaproteobacteria bacterium]